MFRKRKFVRAPSMLSAKGNTIFPKGNAVYAKGKMLSAKENMVFAEGNLETSCPVRNRGSQIQRERKFRKTHFLNVFRSSLEDADVAKRPKILKNPRRVPVRVSGRFRVCKILKIKILGYKFWKRHTNCVNQNCSKINATRPHVVRAPSKHVPKAKVRSGPEHAFR